MSKTPRQNREIERQFLIAIKRATTWHLLLAIFLLLRQHAKLSARSLRPVDLLIPVAFFQMLIFVYAVRSARPIMSIGVGNIILAGLAMLPSIWHTKELRGESDG